jgi:hypothetical protein
MIWSVLYNNIYCGSRMLWTSILKELPNRCDVLKHFEEVLVRMFVNIVQYRENSISFSRHPLFGWTGVEKCLNLVYIFPKYIFFMNMKYPVFFCVSLIANKILIFVVRYLRFSSANISITVFSIMLPCSLRNGDGRFLRIVRDYLPHCRVSCQEKCKSIFLCKF